jgi:Phytanoyl-CoA dioxygenase (PhyH)
MSNLRGLKGPLNLLNQTELLAWLNLYQKLADGSRPCQPVDLCQLHTSFSQAVELGSDPRLLDAVHNHLGEDVLLWDVAFYSRGPKPEPRIWWHRDPAFWGVDHLPGCVAWIALTDTTAESGCLRVIPGSHLSLPPAAEAAFSNALRRSWSFARTWDDRAFGAPSEDLPMTAGQCVLFDLWLVHGAAPITQLSERLALAIKYVVPDGLRMGDWRKGVLISGSVKRGPVDLLEHPVVTRPFADRICISKEFANAYREFQIEQRIKFYKQK